MPKEKHLPKSSRFLPFDFEYKLTRPLEHDVDVRHWDLEKVFNGGATFITGTRGHILVKVSCQCPVISLKVFTLSRFTVQIHQV